MRYDDIDMLVSDAIYSWNKDDTLEHTGTPHEGDVPHSGRYEWGSGKKPLQHAWDLKAQNLKLKSTINPETNKLYTEVEIAKFLGYYKLNGKGEPILDENGQPQGNTKALRANLQIATETIKADNYMQVKTLRDKGMGWTDIAKKLNLPNESSARSIYKNGEKAAEGRTKAVADELKKAVDAKGYIDVGSGSNQMLGVTPNALDTALERLKAEGYEVQNIYLPQLGSNLQKTTMRVLAKPGSTVTDIWNNRQNIHLLVENDDGVIDTKADLNLQPIPSIDSKRISINYGDQTGKEQDGLVELRAIRNKDGSLSPACEDLSLGEAKYGQVRIAVDGKYYIKGMARYNPDLPEGVDILVNSNKPSSKGMENALKKLDLNAETNPFGTNVIATGYEKDGKMVRSPLNIVGSRGDAHVEGAWDEWSKNLPAQFLSKQPEALVKQQLQLTKDVKTEEFNKIMSLTNPTVKKQLLEDFAESCDASAVDLKAIKLPGQVQRVLLPLKTIKNDEIYAPGFDNGTKVALIRYPHAGPWEIPLLTVNNKNKEANTVMKNARDAVGINAHNLSILSGADTDGDTATCVPITKILSDGSSVQTVKMKTHNDIQIPALQDYDTTAAYGPDNYGWDPNKTKKAPYKLMTKQHKGVEMGVVSNLITDMGARGCDNLDELRRADMYSMVVIDAEKHKLNYEQAYKDLGIEELQKKYQINPNNQKGYGGASSLLSRSKSQQRVVLRDLRVKTDPVTGEKIYQESGKATYVMNPKIRAKDPVTGKLIKDANGKVINETKNGSYKQLPDGSYTYDPGAYPGSSSNYYLRDRSTGITKIRQQKSTKMAEATDARTLMSDYDPTTDTNSGTALPIEKMYAEYANFCKDLGNKARLAALPENAGKLKYDKEAAKEYKDEVLSLKEKLRKAQANSPRERQAQNMAYFTYRAEALDHPEWDNDTKKKHKGMALEHARAVTGAKKDRVTFSDREWEAIQKGAIAEDSLRTLLKNANKEDYTKRALPREDRKLSDAEITRIKNMFANGLEQKDIANTVGVSASTVSKILSGKE